MKNKKVVVMVATALVVLAVAGSAFALTGTTGKGQELYDLIVTDFIKGPIGAAAGTGFMVVGAVMAVMGKISGAIWPLIGGGILAAASSLASSLGMIC